MLEWLHISTHEIISPDKTEKARKIMCFIYYFQNSQIQSEVSI